MSSFPHSHKLTRIFQNCKYFQLSSPHFHFIYSFYTEKLLWTSGKSKNKLSPSSLLIQFGRFSSSSFGRHVNRKNKVTQHRILSIFLIREHDEKRQYKLTMKLFMWTELIKNSQQVRGSHWKNVRNREFWFGSMFYERSCPWESFRWKLCLMSSSFAFVLIFIFYDTTKLFNVYENERQRFVTLGSVSLRWFNDLLKFDHINFHISQNSTLFSTMWTE